MARIGNLWSRSALLLAGLATSACIPQSRGAELPSKPHTAPAKPVLAQTVPAPVHPVQQSAPPQDPLPPPAAASSLSPVVMEAQRKLDQRVRELGSAFGGSVGIAVRDVQTGWTTSFNGSDYFPQQSASKLWVAVTALDKVDKGDLDMTRPVTLRRDDLTLFHQPIRAQILRDGGYTTTLADLMYRALTQSDNTANDFLLRRAGGSDAVRDFMEEKGLSGIRFGPGERLLQSQTAGMKWESSYSLGNGFEAARAKLPIERRRAALERYLEDPIDGATPLGIVNGLTRLQKGELLTPGSTQRLLATMSSTRTGPQRLKGGLAPGWRLAHKTGTGQVLGGTSTGYNDIGILTAPDGRAYAVAVMIGRTTRPIPQRFTLMQSVVRAVIAYTDDMRGE